MGFKKGNKFGKGRPTKENCYTDTIRTLEDLDLRDIKRYRPKTARQLRAYLDYKAALDYEETVDRFKMSQTLTDRIEGKPVQPNQNVNTDIQVVIDKSEEGI